MFPIAKNAYLQLNCSDVHPRLLNRAVDRALDRISVEQDFEPPFLPRACPTPYLFGQNVDPTRATPAFGNWAVPKLIKQLRSGDADTRRKALCSMSDVLRDPEKCYQAITLCIVRRIADLLVYEDAFTRERSALILGIVASHGEGARRIMLDNKCVENFKIILDDGHPMVQMQTAYTAEVMSRAPWVADMMVEQEFIECIKAAIQNVEMEAPCVALLEALANLVLRDPDRGLDLGLLDYMMYLINLEQDDYRILGEAAKVVAMLVQCPRGQEEADEKDIIPVLVKLVMDERSEVHTLGTLALQSATTSLRSRWRAREFTELPRRLTTLAGHRKNISVQTYAMQAMQNICDMPGVREGLLYECLIDIEQIQTDHSPHLAIVKERLIKNIRWVPWDISSPFDEPYVCSTSTISLGSNQKLYQIPQQKDVPCFCKTSTELGIVKYGNKKI